MKNAIRLLPLLIFCILASVEGSGQSHYQPGFVVLASGDTLRGALKDRKKTFLGPKIYKKLRFKERRGRLRRKYRPEQLQGYQINETAYESLWLRPLSSGLNLTNAYYETFPYAGECVFVRVVEKGAISHYHLEWEDGADIATTDLLRRNNEPILIRATQGLFGLKRKNLINYFTECPELQEKIRQKELKYAFEIVNFYNHHCATPDLQ